MRTRRFGFAPIVLAGSLILTSCGTTSEPAARGGSAFVRVNQLGYPSAAPKRAFVLSSAAEAGATFAIHAVDGSVVASAPIGERLGRWSARYPHVTHSTSTT